MWHVFASKRIADGRAWKIAAEQLRAHSIEFRLCTSRTSAQHDSLVESAVRNGASQFMAAGGDGATHLLVNALMHQTWETPPTLALLPLGSGCDFARSFGLPSEAAAVARMLGLQTAGGASIHAREVDVGIAKGEWGTRFFVNVASIGLTAAIVRRAARLSGFGALRYLAAFWVILPTYRRRSFLVRYEQGEHRSSSMLGVMANGGFFGGGFRVAPTARLDDSMLELLIASTSRLQMVAVLYRLWRSTHLRCKNVTCRQVREASVACDPPTDVEADGEYLGTTPVEFSVLPRAIRVVCPDDI